eukprot:1173281-Prorocentrum_minimum.AAC.1
MRGDATNGLGTVGGDKDGAVFVHRHPAGVVQLRGGAFAIPAALVTGARQCGHVALPRDLADAAVALVRHDDVALHVHRDAGRVVELGGGPSAVSIPLLAVAC